MQNNSNHQQTADIQILTRSYIKIHQNTMYSTLKSLRVHLHIGSSLHCNGKKVTHIEFARLHSR